MKENLVVIREPKTFYFDFYYPRNVNLEQEIKFIIKSNYFLAENKMKNEIEKLFSKCNHGNAIHEHGKL